MSERTNNFHFLDLFDGRIFVPEELSHAMAPKANTTGEDRRLAAQDQLRDNTFALLRDTLEEYNDVCAAPSIRSSVG